MWNPLLTSTYLKSPWLTPSFVFFAEMQTCYSPFSPRFFFVLSIWSLSWMRTCRSLGWSRINGCFISCSVAGRWLWFFTKQLSINDWNFFDLTSRRDEPTDKKTIQRKANLYFLKCYNNNKRENRSNQPTQGTTNHKGGLVKASSSSTHNSGTYTQECIFCTVYT